jgi:hypothetical protein
LVPSFGEAKEGTRSPQGSETTRSKERKGLRSDETSKWIPAFAGMTAACDAGQVPGNARQSGISSR